MISPARSVLVVLLAGALVAGCGGNDAKPSSTPSPTLPTDNVTVPAGVTLTKPGAELAFGQSATVAYAPNTQRSSVLQLTVTGVTQGSIADLSSYVLDDRTKASNPYYVRVTVKNVGSGDVGRSPVPLWAVDGTNTLIQASSFTNSFTKCPSTPLPTTFAPNATVTGCLVYLVPNHGTLTGVSYRPLQAYAPIVWKGAITPAPVPKKTTKTKKKKAAS